MKYSWFIILMVLSKLWFLFSLMRIFRMTYLDYQCMRFELLPSQFWLKSYYPKIFACQIEDKNPILMATNLKEVSTGLWQEVILSEIEVKLSTS
ncbi:hypothetical protein ACE6H2_006482 [Prunus campanulata]